MEHNKPCLHLVECFEDGGELLEAAEHHGLEALFRSVEPRGEYRGWVKVKTNAWRAANQERWRLFERTH